MLYFSLVHHLITWSNELDNFLVLSLCMQIYAGGWDVNNSAVGWIQLFRIVSKRSYSSAARWRTRCLLPPIQPDTVDWSRMSPRQPAPVQVQSVHSDVIIGGIRLAFSWRSAPLANCLYMFTVRVRRFFCDWKVRQQNTRDIVIQQAHSFTCWYSQYDSVRLLILNFKSKKLIAVWQAWMP
jgi:hypothetical protein